MRDRPSDEYIEPDDRNGVRGEIGVRSAEVLTFVLSVCGKISVQSSNGRGFILHLEKVDEMGIH